MMIPLGVSLKNWAASLIVDFPKDNVPALINDSHWQQWGDLLIQEDSFAINGAPGTLGYSDWKSWAQDFFYSMCNF